MQKKILLLLLLPLLFISCSTIRGLTDIQEPSVEFTNVSIQNISFDGVTLLFDFDVTNPNSMGVNAEGYSYEFFINDQSFLNGTQDEAISIEKESKSLIQVPVSMSFSELYETFGSLVRQDSLSYKLSTEVDFDLAALGSRKVPVEASGVLPIPKPPRIRFGGIDVKNMSFSGADVEATFRVTNPNAFGIVLSGAKYILDVNGRNWLDTELEERIDVSGSENKTIVIPIRLNTAQMGSAMLDIMGGNKEFNYKLRGSAQISADLEGFSENQELPFELEGVYQLD
ncbi:MAG: LEA type 2 family protein [Balneolaceae bacterium]